MLGTRDFLSQFCFTVLLTGSSSDRISVTFQHKKRENVTDYVTEMSLIHFGLFTDRHERLEQQYGNQLEICKAVMQHLTGKPVKEALLLSI